MDEYWRPIPDFPNYSVSNYGRVRNETRGRLVQPTRNPQGALKVGLVIGGKQYGRSLKVLVGEAFCGGPFEKFDTPMLLDGNQENVTADNITYRPRWFAWKYARQFENLEQYLNSAPVRFVPTGEEYINIAAAGIINGFLFREILISIVSKDPVWPSWSHFEWVS